MTPEALYAIFGPQAFEPGLFYANEPALRFELSRSGKGIDLFVQAFDRAREVLHFLFRESKTLVVVAVFFGPGPLLRHRAVVASLRACGIALERPRSCWKVRCEEKTGDSEERALISFRANAASLDRLLWGALAADLGIEPRLDAWVYIADPERGVLVHPYDDRGMDVIGPNRELLKELFQRYREYLLPYDMPRMEGFFVEASAGRGKRILVVDDEKNIVRLIQQHLERQGYQVESAGNGKEALARIQQNRPDLVIADVDENMPVMTGEELITALGRDPTLRDLPFIRVKTSSYVGMRGYDPEAEFARRELGKPFNPAELAAWAQRLLSPPGDRR